MFELIKNIFKRKRTQCGHGNNWLVHDVDESTWCRTSGSGEYGTCKMCERTDIHRPEPS